MKLDITVTKAEAKILELTCKIHESYDANSRILSKEFYLDEGRNQRIPNGIHNEIEIISPDLQSFPNFEKLHIHHHENRPFVCWIWPMPTINHVLDVLEIWAAGSVYTITTGKLMENLFTKEEANNNDFKRVLNLLKDEYLINVDISMT